MVKRILITGANGGLGKEVARQFALLEHTEKIYLACRNQQKAKDAKRSLENSTGKSIFEIIIIDVSNLESVRSVVTSLNEPIDALIMNAGGTGGKNFNEKTVDGVTQIFATNILGHVVLLEELLKSKKLTQVALYAGSEAARGVPKMGLKRPKLQTSSVDEFVSIGDGSYFADNNDPMFAYGHVKYMAALWVSSMSRQHPNIRFVTVSPGSTSGTNVANDLNLLMRILFAVIGPALLPLIGLMHTLKEGARRYVKVINDESYDSGAFYASQAPILTGPLLNQGTIFADLNNETFQDNANEAIHRFIP
jgi:NAD(P)-dependent dehydrogenase (short-subunit alcohol dehydrogenase family)